MNHQYNLEMNTEKIYEDLKHFNLEQISYDCLYQINVSKYLPENILFAGQTLFILEAIKNKDIHYFDDIYYNLSNTIKYYEVPNRFQLFQEARDNYFDIKNKKYDELFELVNLSLSELEVLQVDDLEIKLKQMVDLSKEFEVPNKNIELGNLYHSLTLSEIDDMYRSYLDEKEKLSEEEKKELVLEKISNISYILNYQKIKRITVNTIFREKMEPEKVIVLKDKISKIIKTLEPKYNDVEKFILKNEELKEKIINRYNEKKIEYSGPKYKEETEEKRLLDKKITEKIIQNIHERGKIVRDDEEEELAIAPVYYGGAPVLFPKDTQGLNIDQINKLKLISIIVYTSLRVADTIHDFNGRSLNLNNYINTIQFFINLGLKDYFKKYEGMTISEIFEKLMDVTEFKMKNLNDHLNKLDVTNKFSNVEDDTMENIANFLKEIYKDTSYSFLKEYIEKIYRPNKDDLKKIINYIFVAKNNIIESLLIPIDKIILLDGTIDKKINTIEKKDSKLSLLVLKKGATLDKDTYDNLKKFFEGRQLGISYDMGPIVLKILELVNDYEKDKNIENKDKLFFVPEKIIAEVWDPADNKNATKTRYNNITNQIIYVENDLLDIDNEKDGRLITICNPDQSLTLTYEAPDKVIGTLNTKQLNIKGREYESKYGEINKVIGRILNKDVPFDPCDGFYVKNSGDWGQVKSAKNNKMILLTEDRLCNEYAVLTDTSSIYAFNLKEQPNHIFFLLHKGKIDKDYNDVLNEAKSLLKQNKNYIKQIEVKIHNNQYQNINSIATVQSPNKITSVKITSTSKENEFTENNFADVQKPEDIIEFVRTKIQNYKEEKLKKIETAWNEHVNEPNDLFTNLDITKADFKKIFLDKILDKLSSLENLNEQTIQSLTNPASDSYLLKEGGKFYIGEIIKNDILDYFNNNKNSFLTYVLTNNVDNKESLPFYKEFSDKMIQRYTIRTKKYLPIDKNHFQFVALIKNKISESDFQKRLPFALIFLLNIYNTYKNEDTLKQDILNIYDIDLSNNIDLELDPNDFNKCKINNIGLANNVSNFYKAMKLGNYSGFTPDTIILPFLKLSLLVINNFYLYDNTLYKITYAAYNNTDIRDWRYEKDEKGNYEVKTLADLKFEYFITKCKTMEDIKQLLIILINQLKFILERLAELKKQKVGENVQYFAYALKLVYLYYYLLVPNSLCFRDLSDYIKVEYDNFNEIFPNINIAYNVQNGELEGFLEKKIYVDQKNKKTPEYYNLENRLQTRNDEVKLNIFELYLDKSSNPILKVKLPNVESQKMNIEILDRVIDFLNNFSKNPNKNNLFEYIDNNYNYLKGKIHDDIKKDIKVPVEVRSLERYYLTIENESIKYNYNLDVPIMSKSYNGDIKNKTLIESINLFNDYWDMVNNPIKFICDKNILISYNSINRHLNERINLQNLSLPIKVKGGAASEKNKLSNLSKEIKEQHNLLFSSNCDSLLTPGINDIQYTPEIQLEILNNIVFLIQNNSHLFNTQYRDALLNYANMFEPILDLFDFNQKTNSTGIDIDPTNNQLKPYVNSNIYSKLCQYAKQLKIVTDLTIKNDVNDIIRESQSISSNISSIENEYYEKLINTYISLSPQPTLSIANIDIAVSN